MAQKFDIGLNAKINEFVKKFSITRTEINDDDVFLVTKTLNQLKTSTNL